MVIRIKLYRKRMPFLLWDESHVLYNATQDITLKVRFSLDHQ